MASGSAAEVVLSPEAEAQIYDDTSAMEQDVSVNEVLDSAVTDEVQLQEQQTAHDGPSTSRETQNLPLTYATLNNMEKRILMRRPVNSWAVLRLKKPTLRRFLRENNTRYRCKDKKQKLVDIVKKLILKRSVRQNIPNVAAQSASASTSNPAPTPVTLINRKQEELHKQRKECQLPPCICLFTFNEIMYRRPVHLQADEVRKLKALMRDKTSDELVREVESRNCQPKNRICRQALIRQIQNIMEEDVIKASQA